MALAVPVTLADVDIRSELPSRPHRSPDYQAERRALTALARRMSENPGDILQGLAETAPCANERERGGDPNLVYEGTEEGERGGSEGEGWRGIRERARNGRSP